MAAATPLMTSAGEPETSPSILANLKVPVVIVSPTLATPRAIPASLQNGLTPMTSSSAPARVPQMPGASTAPAKQEEGNGSGDSRSSSSGHQEEETNDRHEEHPSIADPEEIDGRATPLASESSRMSHSGSNGPADQSQSNHSISPPIPPPASYTNGSGISSLPQAEIGLSTLVTEQQLKETAKGKDRMFLLLLSREIESFVARSDQAATNGTSSPAHTSMAVTTATTSKYQKMLVYKMAEWYGLRGLSGPDGTIHITVVGTLEPKSTTLRFADIAPKPPSPKQNFRIMQRVPLGSDGTNGSRAGSVVGDDGLEVGTSKRKTLEEREAEYALARERIYGSSDEPTEPSATLAGSEKANIASTAVGATNPSGEGESSTQPVYASLQRSVHSNTSQQPPSHDRPYAQNPYADPTYLAEQNALVYGYGAVPGDFAGSDPSGSNGMHYNGHGAYPQNPEMGYPSPSAGFGQYAHWQGQAGYPGPQPGQQMMPGAWGYPNPPTMPPGHAGQPMPMIPQGAPAFPYQQYGYPQMQPPTYPQGNGYGMYGHLAQPTPTRPAAVPHTHSSTSSSISSRSYQDFSRPHSRGSTTSNRSAASSVRLGAMYPAGGSGPGYRQKGMKGPTFSGMSSMGGNDRRQSRGHSPSSATTTSSKSSRRASIQLQPPQAGQHQLPRKPDWAANNISYHPSPIPPQPQPGAHGPSTSDFPPLLRQNNGTDAVPMQMERAKLMGVNVSATAWNGNATIRGPQGHLHLGHIMQPGALPPSPALSTANGSYAIPDYNGGPQGYPMHPRAQGYNPQPIISPGPSQTPVPRQVDGEDPDFPRRVITTKTAASLYDPSAESASARPTSATEPIPTSARAVSAAAVNVDGLSPEEAIEAKLAALSVSAGISIGPAPNKQVASYAKIVRRD